MKTIYKYPLEVVDEQKVELPVNSQILCIQSQNEQPQLWAIIDKEEERTVSRTILCRGTGHELCRELGDTQRTGRAVRNINYIDTIQLLNGKLVFHFFEQLS